MMSEQNNSYWVILVVLFAVTAVILLLMPHLKRQAEWRRAVRDEREVLLRSPIPDDIQRSISEYRSGIFVGEDQSPLAYIGYRVGVARGLNQQARRDRLNFCFRMEIPADLPSKYQRWAARRRFPALFVLSATCPCWLISVDHVKTLQKRLGIGILIASGSSLQCR